MSKHVLLLTLMLVGTTLLAGQNKGERRMERAMGGRTPEIEFVLKHDKELSLTADQKKQLNSLKDKVEDSQDKLRKDPEARELFRELAQARKAGDEEKLRQLREKVAHLNAKGGESDKLMAEFLKIMTPDQLEKLRGLREDNGMAMDKRGDGKGLRKKGEKDAPVSASQKPDPNKAPSLYENEK